MECMWNACKLSNLKGASAGETPHWHPHVVLSARERNAVLYAPVVQVLIEIDCADFDFNTSEAQFHFFFYAGIHFIEISHPYESIDGYSFFSL